MDKKLIYTIGIVLGVLMCLSSVVMFLMNIWIPDVRWGQTGIIMLFAGVIIVIASAASRDLS